MTVDAHAHIVSDDLASYPTAPLSGVVREGDLDDPITAERLLRLLDANGVERAVVVQRAHIYGYDNRYVVDAAARYPDRLRAVCAIDARAEDAADRVRYWISERGAIGIRLTEPVRGADTSWLDSPNAYAAWETATELRIPVRLHFFRWNREVGLPAVASLLRRFPETTVVIDHLSNLSAENGPPDFGLDRALAALADFSNLYLLFSSINLLRLESEGVPSHEVIEHVAGVFGADRIMWGSDIGQSKATYAEMRALADAAVSTLSEDDRCRLLHETARSVYI
jgi:L-fuconolactonase